MNIRHISPAPLQQQGAAFIVMMVILVLGITTFFVSGLNSASLQNAQDKVTAESLAQAREALVGYAVKVQISNSNGCSPNCPRPGDLPCPDRTNDGIADSCSNQSDRLGRLPWKTLGLPDLRDGSGERLWYAVSNSFKNNPRSGTLNSDTVGTISLFASNGMLTNDGGTAGTGVAAVIIAPGNPLIRQDTGLMQDRSSSGINTSTNYLDYAVVSGVIHDNSAFVDSSSADGFIQGRIKISANGMDTLVLNDQVLAVSLDSLMPGIQKRVAAEVKNCLVDYAANNNGRYPWAAPITDLGSTYNDQNDTYFGRIPDDLTETRNDSSDTMNDQWGTCNTHFNNTPAGWWLNWKEQVFYAVSRRYRPRDTTAPAFPSACDSTGRCVNVNDTSQPARFVVIVAGKRLTTPFDQTNRSSNRSNADYFLEGGNQNADPNPPSDVSNLFISGTSTNTFNDTLVFQ
jgi:hypothetical protein